MPRFLFEAPSSKKSRFAAAMAALFSPVALGLIMGCVPPTESRSEQREGERKIPEITFGNLSPPYLDHDYFKGSEQHPFQIDATAFSTINAWWMAEASTLVYAEEDFVRPRFRAAGLHQISFFRKLSTQCYVAHNDKFAIVAFRGSEIRKRMKKFDLTELMADLKTDLNIWPTEWDQGGKVHRGFKAALDEVWPELFPFIRRLEENGCAIWITGHSLGGALATLCAGRFHRARGVYTYGSPRVGDGDFREHLAVDIYRVVNNNDIVPRLPSLGTYVHVGELKFIDADGSVRGDPAANTGENPCLSASSTGAGLVPAAFREHVPLLYAVHLWNNMVRQQR